MDGEDQEGKEQNGMEIELRGTGEGERAWMTARLLLSVRGDRGAGH